MGATLSITLTETDVDTAANTSTVKGVVKVKSTNGSWNGYSPSGWLKINGTKYTFSHSFSKNTTTTLFTKSVTVAHNADGSKTVSANASYSTGVSPGTITASKSLTLTKITRAWTVSYNANGGSGAPASQTKNYGTTLTLSSTQPTRTGYTFMGWATSSTGSVAYSAGGSYTNNAAATLYAVWQANTYTINFVTAHGSGLTKTVTFNNSFTFPTLSNVSGWAFDGWATTAGGSVTYLGEQSITWTTAANQTYYAVWHAVYTEAIIDTNNTRSIRNSTIPTTVTFYLSWIKNDSILKSAKLYTKLATASTYGDPIYTWGRQTSTVTQLTYTNTNYSKTQYYDVKWELEFEYVSGSVVLPIIVTDFITKTDYIWKAKSDSFEIMSGFYDTNPDRIAYKEWFTTNDLPKFYDIINPLGCIIDIDTTINPDFDPNLIYPWQTWTSSTLGTVCTWKRTQ